MLKDLQTANLPQDVFLVRYGSHFKNLSQIAVKEYIFTWYTGEFRSSRKITVTSEEEFLGMFLNLENSFSYLAGSKSSGLFKRTQFNLVYLPPQVQCRYILPKGHFAAVTLQFGLPVLEKVKNFPRLSKFLDKVRHKVPARLLLRKHFTMGPEITSLLHEIYADQTEPIALRHWLQSVKMERLVVLALDQMKKGFDPASHRPKCDIGRITEACRYLADHLHEPFSMARLEDVTGLDEHKLQQGFKEIYKLTVFDKLTLDRLLKASDELRHTRKTVKEIAGAVGYTRRAFIRVFKRKIGLTPKEFRNEKTG